MSEYKVGQSSFNMVYRYSGDTMPCDDLIDAGSNATLLVHEATMGDDEEEMALKKRHSTVGQAIDVARR